MVVGTAMTAAGASSGPRVTPGTDLDADRVFGCREDAGVGAAVRRGLAGLVLVAVQAVDADGVEGLQITLAHAGVRQAVHPGGEDAVEQGLHQGRPEEPGAAVALEADAERLFQRGTDGRQRGGVARGLHARQPVPRIRGE